MPSEVFTAAQLLQRLPHRHPLALLDRVEVKEPGKSGVGFSCISISDPVFSGHFPNHPIYPGVLLVESAAQTAGVIATTSNGDRADIALLATVRRFHFRKPVLPGDLVEIHCRFKARAGDLKEFSCEVLVDGEKRADGYVSIAINVEPTRG